MSYNQLQDKIGGQSDLIASLRMENAALKQELLDVAAQLREWSHERVVSGKWADNQCERNQRVAAECERRAAIPNYVPEDYCSIGGMAADLGENVNDVGNGTS